MYEYVLDTKVATLVAAALVSLLIGTLVGGQRIGLRAMLFNYGPAFASAFFLVGFFHESQVSGIDLTAGFLLEFLVLLAFVKLFGDAWRSVRRRDDSTVEPWLRWTLAFQVAVALPLVASEGFGIFSDGSRIAYLDEGGTAKYLTYASVLISIVQSGILAKRLSAHTSLGATGYAIVLVNFAMSTLSGSKGAFFLWLLAVLALIDYRRVRVRWATVLSAFIAMCAALSITAGIASELLGISLLEFGELASSRFFLYNDARALAFDFGGGSAQVSELAASSFRGLFSLLGHPPMDPPLGLKLYEQYFGISTGNGANASLMAIITYYSGRGYTFLPVLVACFGLLGVYASIIGFRRIVRGNLRKLAVTLTGLVLIQQFSQDFLAFQLLIPLAFVAGLILLVSDRKYAGARTRRPLLPSVEHSHPGSRAGR